MLGAAFGRVRVQEGETATVAAVEASYARTVAHVTRSSLPR
jgi:hypothetical protein